MQSAGGVLPTDGPTGGSSGGFWVFGYGSLIWNPGFVCAEQQLARLQGYRRAFCMYSFHYRGTRENPGLVLALDPEPQALCEGVAFRVAAEDAAAVAAYLRERELVSYAYDEVFAPVTLADGRRVRALCYVVNRAHEQYAGGLDLAAQAAIIARARGRVGPNAAYLDSTVEHLRALGIADPQMERLAEMVRAARQGTAR